MNRIGVVTEVLAAIATPAAGELLLVDSLGVIVDATHVGPYAPPTTLTVLVGTAGGPREIGVINPNNFTFESYAYRAAVGKTWKLGYVSGSGVYVTIDVTAATNVGKFGTLTAYCQDFTHSVVPNTGLTWSYDIQIATGETVASYLAKLNAKAALLVAAANAALGATVLATTTSGSAGTSMVQFTVAAGYDFTFTLDGTFDGSTVQVTAGATSPVISGQTGLEVRAKELEGAILDGYNPVQTAMYQMFDTSKYVSALVGTNYDGIIIKTTSDKQYPSPGHPKGWDVLIELFAVNSSPGALGTHAAEIVALLTAVKAASLGQKDMLTKTAADLLYAAHG
jgi:hypothetical protein